MSSGGADLVSLTRFTDAVYAKSEDGSRTKEMYQITGGPILYRGLTPSELAGVSPFFMLDMPVGMVLYFLAHQFKQPCTVSRSGTQFSYVLPAGNNLGIGVTNVTGSATRVGDTAIAYKFTATENKERGATISMSGKIEFSAVGPIPIDTVISDWVIKRGTPAANPEKLIEPSKVVRTIKDLRILDSSGAKP